MSTPRSPLRRVLRRLPLNAAAALTVVICLFPVYWMVTTAFKPSTDIQSYDPRLIPRAWTLDHFHEAVSADGFVLFWRNSILVTLSAVLLALLVALGAAYAVARMRWRGRRQFMLAVFVAQMAPWESLIIPVYIISRDTGMLDRLPTLTLIYFMITLPFTVVVLRGFIAGIPPELEEAAQVDGCTRAGAFRRVAFPLLAPGLMATSLFGFITAWNEFTYANFLIIKQQDSRTLPVWLSSFQSTFGTDWGATMAAATLFALPALIIFLALQRHVTAGLASGGVKG
ncbi:carbohydrate ABC transporter permease [Streptomyces coelicoflavus]|uniref:carbohydrate ABC transporter permease n=1 Tax=Streptomyces TaxID=1883 RepID=UPI00129203F2|nr:MULTISPECIES: carbohydrate ABC transporter permease [Streptomyces]MCX5041286.1 carbohydrate ABC transporter permease [Streptomyces coelicoflavus]MDI6516324.1 carbohydrate ABC transporter permease [Streptomyces coelicoflavus]NHI04805.1 sugar transporter membrane protein [Streptomyces sp. KO7888]QFX79679.1 ABC transporter permease subunit [Streptomyces sp. SYP-A7193]